MIPLSRIPTHPGEILQEEFLKPLNISQEQLAKHLGGTWTQSKISEIINKKRRVTESIALDFADIFGTSSEFWINLQTRYDLWIAKQSRKPISRLPQLTIINSSSDTKITKDIK
jgi:antitoxin HigA-1